VFAFFHNRFKKQNTKDGKYDIKSKNINKKVPIEKSENFHKIKKIKKFKKSKNFQKNYKNYKKI
jgi:hypothetical protein